MVRKTLKQLLFRICPKQALILSSIRARRKSQRLEESWGQVERTIKLAKLTNDAVIDGPFRAMRYPPKSLWRNNAPKLCGTYEKEVYPFLEQVLLRKPQCVIDVGCSEGYYAVGTAMRLPSASVFAFDLDPWARHRTREMAELNGVRNLIIKGECTQEWLVSNIKENTLLIVDCEGCEKSLLDNFPVSQYPNSCWMIELHEEVASDVVVILTTLFESAFQTELVMSRQRNLEDACVELRQKFPEDYLLQLMIEVRNMGQHWLLCWPK